MKRTIWTVAALAFAALFWFGWPIYGYLSAEHETFRSPFGWTEMSDTAPATAQLYDDNFAEAGEQALALLERRRAKITAPSLSAAVAVDGELVWAGAVGWQDVKAGKAATERTVYRLGSTSKSVMATGLARLVANDTMELDRPIVAFAPDLPNANWENLTARQLASHTAGMTDYEANNDWIGLYQSVALQTRFEDPVEALSVFDGADPMDAPGITFHYSGFDNVLLSAVMQEAASLLDVGYLTYDEVMRDSVFAPLGLTSIATDSAADLSGFRAQSYQMKGRAVKPWRTVDLSHKIAAGGYVGTPSDVAKLGMAWLDEGFIPEAVREDFWTPIRLSNGEVNEQDYALGFRRKSWPIDGVGDVVHLNHGGVSKGSQFWLMIVPKHNISVAIATNRRTEVFFDFADIYVDLLEVFIPAAQSAAP